MSRTRHLLVVTLAALPLLVVVLVMVGRSDVWVVLSSVALWLVGVGVLAAIIWRETVLPLAEVVTELGVDSPQHARWRVREVQGELVQSSAERAELESLFEDVSNGLGEGLLVVRPDLRIRLANAKARHFLGVATLAP
ncbi:MAG: hypothetical protein PVG53_05610, partial [Holophagae bacterium]